MCDSCNTGLGRFKDNPKFLEKVIEYLKRHENS
ncbi:endonuclease domain-containing protein [Helicobacter bizzozeronii]|nr:endonuclease domain-containing protein [Helicobacter bizzozeronii]